MKHFLSVCTLVAIASPIAIAQNTTTPSPQDAKKELDIASILVKTTNLWEKRFDWKETGSSMAGVIAHARQMLGPDAPPIEVRGNDTSRSSFTLQQAPLGSVLCSLAELANDKVWVFPGRIVLSPESELSAEEKEAVKNNTAGQWKQTYKWDAYPVLEKAHVGIIVADMKTKLAAKGQTAPAPLPPPPTPQNGVIMQNNDPKTRYASYELPFGELNQLSQQSLQFLLNDRYSRVFGTTYVNGKAVPIERPGTPKLTQVGPEVRVCWDEANPYQKTLFLRGFGDDKRQFMPMQWYVSERPPLAPRR